MKCVVDAKRKFSVLEKTRCFYVVTVSPYTIVLCKIDSCSCKKAAQKAAKTAGKDSSGESVGLHCVYRQKDNRTYKLEACEIAFFEKAY